MALEFPKSPNIVFERPPLRVVLCQIQFPPIYSLLGNAGVTGFQEAIRSDYPSSSRIDASDIHVAANSLASSNRAPTWRFTDKDENWTVSIGVNFVSLDTKGPYSHFGDFLTRLKDVLEALHRTVYPDAATRIGLRKINELTNPQVAQPRDWHGLLNPAILGPLSLPLLPGEVQRDYAELVLRDEAADALSLRYGVVDRQSLSTLLGGPALSGEGLKLKARISEDDIGGSDRFILDFDYSSNQPLEVAPGELLTQLLTDLSNSISSFFLWCLEDPYYEYLGPHERQE